MYGVGFGDGNRTVPYLNTTVNDADRMIAYGERSDGSILSL